MGDVREIGLLYHDINTKRRYKNFEAISGFTPDHVIYDRLFIDYPEKLDGFLDADTSQLPYLGLINKESRYSSKVLDSLLVLCGLLNCNPPHIFLIGTTSDTYHGETYGFDEYISVIPTSGGNGHLTGKEAEQVAKEMLSKLDI